MFETYIPGFSNMLMKSGMAPFQPELTGGGPAMVDFLPFLPEVPLTATAPIAKAPFDVPIMRDIKDYTPALPSTMLQPDLFDGGGPAMVDFSPYATPTPLGPIAPQIAKAPFDVAPLDVPIMREIKSPDPLVPVAKAPFDVPIMREIKSPSPDFTNTLMRPELTGGGPAMVDFSPYATPASAEPTHTFMPEVPAATPPSVMPSPSAPPIMPSPSAPPMMSVAAPVATPAPAIPAITNPFPDIPAINPVFIGTGLGGEPTQRLLDLYTDPATGLMVNRPRSVELDETGRVVREITPEGSVPGVYFSDDRGMPATTGLGIDARFTPLNPNAVYTVVNERTGEVVSTGTGAEGMRAAQAATAQLSEAGRRADWTVLETDPNTGAANTVANVDPRRSDLGAFADIVLPAAGAILLPGVGGALGGALGAGLGAAGGSALSSIAQGRSLEDTLLRAGLTGVTAGGLAGAGSALGGAAGGGASGVGGSLGGALAAAGPAAQAALNATLPGIVVSGALGSVAGGALGSAAGSVLGSVAGGAVAPSQPAPTQPQQPTQQPTQPRQPVEITPEGNLILTGTPVDSALPIEMLLPAPIVPALPSLIDTPVATPSVTPSVTPAPAPTPEPEIVVTAPPQTPGFNVITGALPGLGAGLPAVIPETIGTPIDVVRPRPVQEEFDAVFPPPPVAPPLSPSVPETIGTPIEVTADPNAPAAIDAATAAAIATGAIPTGGILPSGQTPTGGEQTLETDRDILDQLRDRLQNLDLADYLRLAGVLSPLLDGIGGGGRRGGLNTIPAGMFGGSGVFGGSLPRPTLPGASTGFAPRAPSTLRPQTTQDWYRYGYGPEQSFFSYVPEGEENKSQAYTGYAHGGMAEGGDRFAVNGPGTGRSDEIPAMLSDGEYVIDAETVALLGDGSSKAGAERLDQFRINVRKHKGRHLAKGDFSVNAKRPEKYLKGGRA